MAKIGTIEWAFEQMNIGCRVTNWRWGNARYAWRGTKYYWVWDTRRRFRDLKQLGRKDREMVDGWQLYQGRT